jgi:uncharacterized protein (TIGR03435 family)
MRFTALSILLSLPAAVLAQTSAPSRSFEVASIHPTLNGDPSKGTWSLPNTGEFHTHSLALGYIVQLAYNVDAKQIEGKPAWFDSDCYDINAKPEGGIKLTREQLRPLLQNLLEQRFHLAVHTETRQIKGYALVVAKGGPKLKAAKGEVTPNWRDDVSAGSLKGRNWSAKFLAAQLTPAAGLPVVDHTGLTAHYDVSVEYAPDLNGDSALPSLFTALQETLGLKLEAQKVPVDFLIVDHIDREPTEN